MTLKKRSLFAHIKRLTNTLLTPKKRSLFAHVKRLTNTLLTLKKTSLFAHVKRLTNTLLKLKKTSYKHANPTDEQSIGLLHVSIKKQHWIPSINTISTSLNVIALVTFAARESTLWRLDNGGRKAQR